MPSQDEMERFIRENAQEQNDRPEVRALIAEIKAAEKRIVQSKQQPPTFSEVVKPVMEWLAKNKHPHMSIIIDATRAELVEGVECVTTYEFVPD